MTPDVYHLLYNPGGLQYRQLLEVIRQISATFSLKGGDASAIVAELAPWQIGEASHGIRMFRAEREAVDILAKSSSALNDWRGPAKPHDLTFWRRDGTWSLIMISEYGLNRLALSEAEAAEVSRVLEEGALYHLDPNDMRPSEEVDAEVNAAVSKLQARLTGGTP
jgi:hypothetical protein